VENSPVPLLGVLISGRGSNLRALIGAVREGRLRARIRVVISNRTDAAGLAFAREAGIETLVMSHRDSPTLEAYDDVLAAALTDRGVTLVCLAGFMRVLGPGFCGAFPDAILNIHPSLLPAFPGLHPQRQALEAGAKVSGATVHLVTAAVDAGPIVLQESVPIHEGDTEASLAARILEVEHRIYSEAVQRVLDRGRRAVLR